MAAVPFIASVSPSDSCSAPRLILPPRKHTTPKAIPLNPLSASGKFKSTEGRFTIIDEKCKESTSIDSDSDHSDGEQEHQSITRNRVSIKCFVPNAATQNNSQPQAKPPAAPPATPHMTSSGSRFKIVPVESRYKRGRWACWDYYDSDATKSAKEARLTNLAPPDISNPSITGLPPVAVTTPNGTMRTAPNRHSDPVTFAFDLSDESDAENTPPTDKLRSETDNGMVPSASPLNRTNAQQFMDGQHGSIKRLVASPDLYTGSITPTEMIQNYGLERSLSATHSDKTMMLSHTVLPADNLDVPKTIIESSATGPGPGGTPQMVAIDSKIEQAMDLVKTHLMFAVREEVEVLRAKIIELESTVIQLEAENSVLRDHVPAEILTKLSMQATQAPATAAV